LAVRFQSDAIARLKPVRKQPCGRIVAARRQIAIGQIAIGEIDVLMGGMKRQPIADATAAWPGPFRSPGRRRRL